MVNLINQMFNSLSSLSIINDISAPVRAIEKQIRQKADTIEEIQSRTKTERFTVEDYRVLHDITIPDLLTEAFDILQQQIEEEIAGMDNMLMLSSATSDMIDFCEKEGIAVPDSKEDRMKDALNVKSNPYYLSYNVLGDKAMITSVALAKRDEMLDVIKNEIGDSLKGSKISIMEEYENDMIKFYRDLFAKEPVLLRPSVTIEVE